MTTREEIVLEAMSWLGTPFVHDGRLKGVGVDCARLVEMTAKACGLYRDAVVPTYGRNPDPEQMRSILRGHLDEIGFKQLGLADILWFRAPYDPQHLGIVVNVDPLTVLHVSNASRGVALMRVFGIWRDKRIAGCFRYRGVN